MSEPTEAELRKLSEQIVLHLRPDVHYAPGQCETYVRQVAGFIAASRQPLIDELHGVYRELHEVEQLAAQALGVFPRYSDDPENFPNATEVEGVCVGEHTAVTLLEALIAKMRPLTWTTERPTQPGWYWIKGEDYAVQVAQLTDQLWWEGFGEEGFYEANTFTHFAGPLPEPGEGEKEGGT